MPNSVLALDAHPRRCFMCATKIFNCNGFVLARDVLPIMRAAFTGQPNPLIKVRELCGKCVFIWGENILCGSRRSVEDYLNKE